MVNNEKMDIMNDREFTSLYQKSKKLIDNARSNMGQMANTITVITSFWLGRYIVEQEQQGQERAKYFRFLRYCAFICQSQHIIFIPA